MAGRQSLHICVSRIKSIGPTIDRMHRIPTKRIASAPRHSRRTSVVVSRSIPSTTAHSLACAGRHATCPLMPMASTAAITGRPPLSSSAMNASMRLWSEPGKRARISAAFSSESRGGGGDGGGGSRANAPHVRARATSRRWAVRRVKASICVVLWIDRVYQSV